MSSDFLLKIEDVSKAFKSDKKNNSVLKNISLNVESKKFVVLLGASGVGKSTLLHLIAGFEKPTTGQIYFEGHPVQPNRKGLSFVFQQPALLPWRTVLENVLLPLEIDGNEKNQAVENAKAALVSVGLQHAMMQYPPSLSGGMSSRVAIARAMVQKPRLLLMDEPFANLDPIMRETFDINLMRFCANRNVTGVFVTHSVEEACLLAHTIHILDDGKIVDTIEVDLAWPRRREVTTTEAYLGIVKKVRVALLETSMANLMPKPTFLKDRNQFVDSVNVEVMGEGDVL